MRADLQHSTLMTPGKPVMKREGKLMAGVPQREGKLMMTAIKPVIKREGKTMTGVPQREGKLMMTASKTVMTDTFTPLHRSSC